MYQDRKLGECKLFRLQVTQRWTLYFWKYGPERNKNSGTKEISSKSDWVRSWGSSRNVENETAIWWPELGKEAEDFCKTCHGWQVVSGPSSPELLHMTGMPLGSKQEIAIDFMSPSPFGGYVFAVTDYYSRYIKIIILTRNTAKVAISSLSKTFATQGFPYTVTRDTSSQFVA